MISDPESANTTLEYFYMHQFPSSVEDNWIKVSIIYITVLEISTNLTSHQFMKYAFKHMHSLLGQFNFGTLDSSPTFTQFLNGTVQGPLQEDPLWHIPSYNTAPLLQGTPDGWTFLEYLAAKNTLLLNPYWNVLLKIIDPNHQGDLEV
jgi:hypothetical protein